MTVKELEAEVEKLPLAELNEFIAWLQNHAADAWDRQIERDILDGRFDELGKEVDEAFRRGECTPL